MSEPTTPEAQVPETPYIIYLRKQQLENILSILSQPSMLGGADIIKRGVLLETIQQAVPVEAYNNTIIKNFMIEQKALYERNLQAKAAEEAKLKAEEEARKNNPPPKPIVANTTATFRPFHIREAEAKAAAEKAAAEKKVTQLAVKPPKKVTPPAKKVAPPAKKQTPAKKVASPAKKAAPPQKAPVKKSTIKTAPKAKTKHRW